MDHLLGVLLKTNYPDWMIKESEMKPAAPIINTDTDLKVKKNIFISVPYVCSLSEEQITTLSLIKHYHQVSGTAVGTKLAPSYANLFMTKFEE